MYNLLILPYRDLYFWSKFGSAVRDLQFLEVLSKRKDIKTITLINRPVSVYERLINKRKKECDFPGVSVIDITSFSIFGPLKKRAWTRTCYKKIVHDTIVKLCDNNEPLIILDFTPISIIPIMKGRNIIYWYDMIDNFSKHNCYSFEEKQLVRDKYKYVSQYYDFVTGVSSAAVKEITNYRDINNYVLPNGVFQTSFSSPIIEPHRQRYDFGFIGFITDKFDVDFVVKLSHQYSIVIYGDVYNKEIAKILKLAGITLKGKFKYNELPIIMKSFDIGLLPYLKEKSHDGSPLKLYEYFKFDKPCITSIDYEYTNEYVVNYNSVDNINLEIKRLKENVGNCLISSSLSDELYLDFKINTALNMLSKNMML